MIGPLAYIGGKRRLAKTLLGLIPPHTTYVEPFGGGAQLLFRKPPSTVEVVNDLDDQIINFFRICQRHPEELARILRWQPLSRRLFEWRQAPTPADYTDVERAARFWYLQKSAWSGKRVGRSFRYGVTSPPKFTTESLAGQLAAVAQRLDRVLLEARPYQDILERYDRPSTFFYCDPPYVGARLYAHNFSDADFAALAGRLATLRGRFLLSINECPKARHWFGRFHIQSIELTYTARRTPARFRELLFANYPLALAHTQAA